MQSTKRRVLVAALMFMAGCAGRKHRTSFTPETPVRFGFLAPTPSAKPEPEQEPPQRIEEQRPPQEPPPGVVAVPTPEPQKQAAHRQKAKRKPKTQAVKRPTPQRTRRTRPAPVVVAAATPEKKKNTEGLPPLAYGLMPVTAAALWMGGRAAVHAARRG